MSTYKNELYTSLRPEVKSLWLEALRSGEYRQATENLRKQYGPNDTPGFCCLGVLCDIAIKEGVLVTESDEHHDNGLIITHYDTEHETLPESVMEWSGLHDKNPDVEITNDDGEAGQTTSLAEANDNGMTFEEIANLIEEQL